jgi:hypothetical protein
MAVFGGTAPAALAADTYPEGGYFEEKNAYIEQNVATKEALIELIQQNSTGSDTLASIVEAIVTPEMVGAIVTPVIEGYLSSSDQIVALAAPMIKGAVADQLGEFGIADQSVLDLLNGIIDEALASDAVDAVLASDFAQDVIARAISYAIADVVASLDSGAIVDAAMADAWDTVADTIFGTAPIDVLGVPVKSGLADASASFPLYTTDLYSVAEANLSYYTVDWTYPVSYSLLVSTDAVLQTSSNHTFTYPGEAVSLKYRSGGSSWKPTYDMRVYTAHVNEAGQLCVTPTSNLLVGGACVAAKQAGKPEALTVTGWNANTVALAVGLGAFTTVGEQVASNPQQYYDDVLANLDIKQIVLDATVRAVKDEVVERVEAKILEIKADIYARIAEALAQFGIVVDLDPLADDLAAAGQKILAAAGPVGYEKLVEYLQAAPITAPAVETAVPPVVGQTVAVTAGRWDPLKTKINEITYEWRVAGSSEVIGTGLSVTVPAAALGRQLEVAVTAPSHLTSMIDGQFGQDLIWRGVFRTPAAVPGELSVVAQPELDNTNPTIEDTIAVVGAEFNPQADLAYQWQADGQPIDGATGASLRVEPAMVGQVLSVEVTASVADGSRNPFQRTLSTTPVAPKPTQVVTSSNYSTASPTVGQTVSLTAPEFSPEAAPVYEWYLDDAADPVATTASVEVLPEWAGHRLAAQVKSAPVVGWTPAAVVLPSIEVAPGAIVLGDVELTGRALVGQTVTAAAGASPAGATVTYEWFEDESLAEPAQGEVVPGSNGASFIPAAGAVGKALHVKATAELTGHATESKSARTDLVESNQIQVRATVKGVAKAGADLVVEAEVSPEMPAAWAYQWTLDGEDIDGATAATHTARPADIGGALAVKVTATPHDHAYLPLTVEQAAGTVAKADVALSELTITPAAPAVGVELRASAKASPADRAVVYTWYRDAVGEPNLLVADSATYTPVPADLGHDLVVVAAVAEDQTHLGAELSQPAQGKVQLGTIKLSDPVVSGTPVVGVPLTAAATADPADATVTYVWKRGGAEVAKGEEYTPAAADLGQPLTVVATANRAGYGTTVAGAATAAVEAGSFAVGQVVVSPEPVVGVASQASVAPVPAGASVRYEWKVAGRVVSSAPSYTPVQDDQGESLAVTAVVSLPGHNSQTLASAPATVMANPAGRINNYRSFTLSPDLDGDGRGEIVAVHHTGEVRVHVTAANGTVTASKVVDQVDPAYRVVAPGDITGDGKGDLMYIDQGGRLYLRNGLGGHQFGGALQQIGWGWVGWKAIPCGDLNGDGKTDLLGINDATGKLFFYPGLGNGLFGAKKQVGWGWSGWNLYSAGDLNGDGKNDILGIRPDGYLFFYPGRGDGTFGSKKHVGQGWNGFTMAGGADLNGDRVADIVGREDSSGTLYYYKGLGQGGFAWRQQIATGW